MKTWYNNQRGDFIKNKKIVILVLLSVLFLLTTILVATQNINFYDNFIIEKVRNITKAKTTYFKITTNFGSALIMILITVLSLPLLKNKKQSLFISINLISSAVINTGLKMIFHRQRPLDMLINETGYSYPSGHSFVSIAFYGFIIYLIINSKIEKKKKYIITCLLSLLILTIGTSRIYLGVHYPSDVLGGFAGGLLYLLIFIKIYRKYGEKNEKERKKTK